MVWDAPIWLEVGVNVALPVLPAVPTEANSVGWFAPLYFQLKVGESPSASETVALSAKVFV